MERCPEVGAAWENGGIVNGAADACPAGEAVRPDEGGKRFLVRRGVC